MGCDTTYLLTTGQLLTTSADNALLQSAAHDLKCPATEVQNVSTPGAHIFEGCSFRVTYEFHNYGASEVVSLASKVPADTHPPEKKDDSDKEKDQGKDKDKSEK